MPPQVVPMLPCADIDQIVEFFVSLGFKVSYRQARPYPYVALEGFSARQLEVRNGGRPQDGEA